MITLVLSDGVMEGVSIELCAPSKLIKEMEPKDGDEIPLPNVDKKTMTTVLKFLEHHLTHPMPEIQKPIKSADIKVVLKDYPWDAAFIDTEDQEFVFTLTLAANYLGIEPLLDLGALRIATWLKGRTPDEVRTIFNLQKPTPEEEEQIRKENAWIFEVRPADAPAPTTAPVQAPAVVAMDE